jgi:hypothetical protein
LKIHKNKGGKMTVGKKIGILAIVAVAAALALIFGTAEVHEDGLVKFRVKGQIFDASTHKPLEGVEVILTMDEWASENKDELNDLFEMYQPLWLNVLDESEWVGKSKKDGEYVAEGGRRYSRKYTSIFGLGRPSTQPFTKAWLAFRKNGYKMKVVELKTAGWKNADISADTFNAVEDVYLER